jgi:hypothetical protein
MAGGRALCPARFSARAGLEGVLEPHSGASAFLLCWLDLDRPRIALQPTNQLDRSSEAPAVGAAELLAARQIWTSPSRPHFAAAALRILSRAFSVPRCLRAGVSPRRIVAGGRVR